jgi:hypothetical protein
VLGKHFTEVAENLQILPGPLDITSVFTYTYDIRTWPPKCQYKCHRHSPVVTRAKSFPWRGL